MRLKTLAALAIVAVSAGCGGTPSSSVKSTTTVRSKAVRFSECMRANGVRAFPDPDASGALTIDAVANGSSIDTSSTAFKQAVSACKDLEPSGFTGHRRSAEQQKAAIKFAQCMRDNGVKDFPDPEPDGPLIDTSRMPGSPGALSIPGFQAAQDACSHYAGEAGVTAP